MSAKTVACPTCGRPVKWEAQSRHRPFCSERCKLIDLGAWAAEDHVIPGDPVDDELFSDDLPPRLH
ncbi:DNA gyrase inhibitor YacG [Pseudomonas oligotrophica]|uniref:DNA gyrase inhibitor YacG n=1 Tax=Pseudomonas oligotrophica TaxID=2912055 RepID=UPI001F00CABB|nr:DNA gyrase inhibitor YacG [Pseudomonas oligotrophica]MCF7203765.1 DNA gyrase inhibitor YacG [Pseudomonas oligotrophica]